MRIMIDTNIFISAALFPKGRAAEALYKAMVSPYQPVVCDYVIDELHRKFQEKFPERTTELEAFLYTALPAFEIVTTPVEAIEAESKIRDPKDISVPVFFFLLTNSHRMVSDSASTNQGRC